MISKNQSHYQFQTVIISLTFIILAAYTYAKFFVLPYSGFIFNNSNGEVRIVFVESTSQEGLKDGDLLLQIGDLSWDDFRNNLLLTLFEDKSPGDIVQITVQRGDQKLEIPWTLPGWNRAEFLDRFNSVLILAYLFWLVGVFISIHIRPRDQRLRLMVAFYSATSLWLAAGSLSAWHIWGSAVLLRVTIWSCVPLYLHLHWVFPKPFRRLPASVQIVFYAIGILLAILQVFQLLPENIYLLGFIAAVLGSFILLAIHFILQPGYRRNIGILIGATVIALLPPLAISLTNFGGSIPITMLLGFLAMPILPGAYFLAAFRRRLGGMELRVNRAISTYVFILLMSVVALLLVTFGKSWIDLPGEEGFFDILAITLAGIAAAISYPAFTRFFERRFLGLPLPPTQLIEIYSERITTSLSLESLKSLIQNDLLPSLLVRQSALLRTNNHNLEPVLLMDIKPVQLPDIADISELEVQAGRYLPKNDQRILPWVRLILPLYVAGELRGLWLLGRRDPDDYYNPSEIDVLKTIANQTAIGLVNIEQTERLRALYQANIERHEQERSNLARDLHDDVLNQFAGFFMKMEQTTAQDFEEDFQEITVNLRQMISGLRPAMLNYGLAPALNELVDEISTRIENTVSTQVDITSSGTRYDPIIEAHLYRIIQQACENALRHAQASSIRIHGSCDPDGVQLNVEDDGKGFPNPNPLDFNQLLADRHYGIAGMFERAALIGAELRIDSAPGEGTKILVTWSSGG